MSQQARRFAGVPLNGVEAVTSIGYVSGGYVLGTGDQIVAGSVSSKESYIKIYDT